jgi:3alpha(or 20beta)-hydroxysteroid dehydrogenase
MGKLEGKVALVSGAGRGQGEAIARQFVAEGGRVVLGDIRDDLGQSVARDLGSNALYRSLDVTRAADWAEAVSTTEQAFGRLDILVNNAGILTRAPIESLTLDDYMRTIQVNQVGCLLGMQAALPLLKLRGGVIVNTSSVAGMQGVAGMAAYTSSKWAIRGLTRTAALEFGAWNIRVNSIHPGAIDTPMLDPSGAVTHGPDSPYAKVPLRRIGRPEEVARLVLFLASDDSAFCTGSEFTIDGGGLAGLRSR